LLPGGGVAQAVARVLALLDWRANMAAQLLGIQSNLRHATIFTDYLSTVTTGVAIDWETVGGGTVVNSTDGDGGEVTALTNGAGAAQVFLQPKGTEVWIQSLRSTSWAAAARAKVLPRDAGITATTKVALVSMFNRSSTAGWSLGVLGELSLTNLALWYSAGGVTVGTPIVTSELIRPRENIDCAIRTEGVNIYALVGDYAKGIALAEIGKSEETGLSNVAPSGPRQWVQTTDANNAGINADCLMGMAELRP